MNSGDWTYIWQAPDWPTWRYDLSRLAGPLADVSRSQGVTFRRNGAGHFRRNDATGNEQFEGSNGDQGCLILPPFASSVLNVSTPGFSPR